LTFCNFISERNIAVQVRKEPLISIVTVVYNGSEFIEETITSVLSQTYKKIEYIIIDGGSTDGTIDVIRNYEDAITYWVSEKDNGMYDALNKGFDRATGDIFAYLNSDDLYKSPDIIEKVVDQFHNSDTSLVFGDIELINKDGNSLNVYKSLALPRLLIKWLARLPFAQQSSFWTREAYKKIGGFDASLKYVADSKFFFTLCLDKELVYRKANFIVAKFRLHDDAFSTKRKNAMTLESMNMKRTIGIKGNNNFRRISIEVLMKIYNIQALLTKFTTYKK